MYIVDIQYVQLIAMIDKTSPPSRILNLDLKFELENSLSHFYFSNRKNPIECPNVKADEIN